MELGQRIKNARLESGLSQRQLCGDMVTRNMLSQIENGSARPSMDTLAYFAQRLGKPVSFFLEEDTVTSPNQQIMEQARSAFREGDYQRVRSALSEYQGPDATFDWEKALLLALAALRLAEQAIGENRIPYARNLLKEAMDAGETTPYYLAETESLRQILLAKAGDTAHLPDVDAVLLLRAEEAIRQETFEKAGAYLAACEGKPAYWQLLQGRICVKKKLYAQAVPYLQSAEEQYPQETIPLLERCFSALEDYKMAYFYACKQKK